MRTIHQLLSECWLCCAGAAEGEGLVLYQGAAQPDSEGEQALAAGEQPRGAAGELRVPPGQPVKPP